MISVNIKEKQQFSFPSNIKEYSNYFSQGSSFEAEKLTKEDIPLLEFIKNFVEITKEPPQIQIPKPLDHSLLNYISSELYTHFKQLNGYQLGRLIVICEYFDLQSIGTIAAAMLVERSREICIETSNVKNKYLLLDWFVNKNYKNSAKPPIVQANSKLIQAKRKKDQSRQGKKNLSSLKEKVKSQWKLTKAQIKEAREIWTSLNGNEDKSKFLQIQQYFTPFDKALKIFQLIKDEIFVVYGINCFNGLKNVNSSEEYYLLKKKNKNLSQNIVTN